MTYNKINIYEKALLNALLSYGVYESNHWLTPNHMIKENIDDNNRFEYEKKLKKFNEKVFVVSNLNLNNGEIVTDLYKTTYNFSNGIYSSLSNLAQAIILESNILGEKVLHVAFRGTDIKSQKLTNFVTKAYFDISEFYKSFKPLENAIFEYANINNIKKIHISGHSLGGAIVQEFFNSCSKGNDIINDTILEGFTFGGFSCYKSNMYKKLCTLGHDLKHKKFNQLLNTWNMIFEKEIYLPEPADFRISQFAHVKDFIPKASRFFYKPKGEYIYLDDSNDVDKKSIEKDYILTEFVNNKIPKIAIKLNNTIRNLLSPHDMLLYIINIENKIINELQKEIDVPIYKLFEESKIDNLKKIIK